VHAFASARGDLLDRRVNVVARSANSTSRQPKRASTAGHFRAWRRITASMYICCVRCSGSGVGQRECASSRASIASRRERQRTRASSWRE
jgi:hypothetical protein